MSDSPSNSTPVMIIGAMKCGTTSLYDYLVRHPQVCPCKVKEPEFFSQHQGHGMTVSRYEDLWNIDRQLHKYTLEASTGYTKYPNEADVPRKIYEYGINPKFIYIIRNPFERIVSQYNYLKTNPHFDLTTSLLDRKFIALSNYYLQLNQFLRYFPNREQYLILDFHDLLNNPESLLQRVFDFLELDEKLYESQDFSVKNKSSTFSTLELFLFRTGLIKISTFLPKGSVKIIKGMLKKAAPLSHPKTLSESEFRGIYNLLSEDMKRFKEEFDFDVERWGFTC